MATFQQRVRRHLAQYKRERLGVLENGVWLKTGTAYSHILPHALHRLNILESIRAEFFAYAARERFKLHTDFHHLNSSQALCFNLFFPFVGLATSDPTPLLKALGVPAAGLSGSTFEADSGTGEGTTLDFAADLTGGGRLMVEVKFTESEFGQAKPDVAHKAKREKHYVPMLSGKVCEPALAEKTFFRHYQLLRNVAHTDLVMGDRLVVLVPTANAALTPGLNFLKEVMLPATRPMVQIVFLEDVLDRLRAQAHRLPAALAHHVAMLTEKYSVPQD